MCSGRVDLKFIVKAFVAGHDGVFVGACRLNECNYVTHGNYDAFGNVLLLKRIMRHIGLNPERLHIEFMSAADGNILAESVNNFIKRIRSLGAQKRDDTAGAGRLKTKLAAVERLVPFLKLVERERFRITVKSRQAYEQFYASDEFERFFKELIADKLALSQIMMLLKDKPLTTGQMAEILGLNPSEISGYMNISSRQSLVRYDPQRKLYDLA